MKIYYWSPFLSKIATVSSVIKSIEAIKSYSNKNTDISIIDSVGEWEQIPEKTKGIKIIKLYKKDLTTELHGAIGYLTELNLQKKNGDSKHLFKPKLSENDQ